MNEIAERQVKFFGFVVREQSSTAADLTASIITLLRILRSVEPSAVF